jgi:hypothetical protein
LTLLDTKGDMIAKVAMTNDKGCHQRKMYNLD